MAEWSGKRIILFSDGTGNSSAKLFKTNVWRLYEALDLGPPTEHRPNAQIAYYDNGVGTSSFKPLAVLGGVFGLGLKRNLLDIYKYLCRNYEEGDKIYAFGFSRGAFTIRLLVALIVQEGVVEYEDEKQLDIAARGAYRAFAKACWPNREPSRTLARIPRWIRDQLVRGKQVLSRQPSYAETEKRPVMMEFVGVWDTVAAYGGPIIEITRAIDDWIWPLSLPNYELSPKVLKARHALSIDDAREAFQPQLWDEIRELDVIKDGRTVTVMGDDGKPCQKVLKAKPGRLEQVWFAGVHADVGGGYPDETLSYVSLAWIMGETDLAYLDQHHERIRTMANAFGPIHDSRAGTASYYRYQPRNISALIDPAYDVESPRPYRYRSLRDPEFARDGYPDHGLLIEVKVHKSVVTRIAHGTDGYAPINMPARWVIYPTDPSEQPKEGSVAAEPSGDHSDGLAAEVVPAVPGARAPDQGKRPPGTAWIERPGSPEGWDRVWNYVWAQRAVYFLTIIPSVLLASMPWWVEKTGLLQVCADARCWGRSTISLLDYFLPGFATRWTAAFSANVALTVVLFVVLVALIAGGRTLDSTTHAIARALLRGSDEGGSKGTETLCGIRESRIYQYGLFVLRWYLLPFVFAVLCVVLGITFLVSTLAQIEGTAREQPFRQLWAPLCAREPEGADPDLASTEMPFDSKSMCNQTGWRVIKDRHYVLTMRLMPQTPTTPPKGTEPFYGWIDKSIPMTPDGALLKGHKSPPYMWLFAGMRRVVLADWMQTLTAIDDPSSSADPSSEKDAEAVPDQRIFVDLLNLAKEGRPDVYSAEFTAARTGNLSVFLNDAMMPFALPFFYNNNKGTACISLRSQDQPPPVLPRNQDHFECGTIARPPAIAAETPK
jgi:uncharacterized protein (DUF2235 family)